MAPSLTGEQTPSDPASFPASALKAAQLERAKKASLLHPESSPSTLNNTTIIEDSSVLTPKDRSEIVFTDKYSSPDVFIDSRKDTLWHPWVGTLELRPLRFETRSGTFVMALRTPVDCWLGKHRHRGTVTAVTIAGNWGYKEYDWIASPGDFVVENPGTIHTLFMGAGAEVVFTVTGSLEFFNDDDSLRETMDVFTFAKMYHDHCKEIGVEANQKLWY